MNFLKKFIGFAVATALSSGLGLGALSLLPLSALPLVIMLLFPALLAGPIVALVVAIRKGGAGGILGVLAAAPLFLLVIQVPLWIQVRDVYELNRRGFLPHGPQSIVLIGEDYHFPSECNGTCLQILLSTPYKVAVEDGNSENWIVFTLAHGGTCARRERVEQYIRLLSQGYLDLCAEPSLQPPSNDALIIRSARDPDSPLYQRVPLHSDAYEFYERLGGQDRLLARWVSSGIPPGSWYYDPFDISSSERLARFDAAEFMSQALNAKIEGQLPRGTAAVPELLEALRPYFADTETLPSAMTAFEDIARANPSPEKDLLRQFLQSRLNEVEALPEPPPVQVKRINDWLKRL
jgi:hypothetical protein